MVLPTKKGNGYAIIIWQDFLHVEVLFSSQSEFSSNKIKIDANNIGDFADTLVTGMNLEYKVRRNKEDNRSVDKAVRFVHHGPLVDIIWENDPTNKICTFNTKELITQIAPDMLVYLKPS